MPPIAASKADSTSPPTRASRSSFSFVPALYRGPGQVTVYTPFWHEPLGEWVLARAPPAPEPTPPASPAVSALPSGATGRDLDASRGTPDHQATEYHPFSAAELRRLRRLLRAT